MESRGPYFPRSAQYKRIEVEKLNKEKSKFFNDFFGLVSITKQNRPSSYIIVHTNHRDVHNWSSWFFIYFSSRARRAHPYYCNRTTEKWILAKTIKIWRLLYIYLVTLWKTITKQTFFHRFTRLSNSFY